MMTLSRRTLLAGLAGLAVLPSGAGAAPTPTPQGLSALPHRRPMLDVAFRSADGDEIAFRDLVGRPVVLVFWATWCGICYGEMPKLNALKADLGADVHVAALSIDREGMARVGPYFERRNLHALVPYIDQAGVIADMMGVRAVPTAFAIDAKGRIAASGEGRVDWDSASARAYLAALAG